MMNALNDWSSKLIEAEENFVIDVQFMLQDMMNKKGISRKELADIAGISKARISQLFDSESNPTSKTLVRLFFALGEEIQISAKRRNVSRQDAIKGWEFDWSNQMAVASKVEQREMVLFASVVAASNDNHHLGWDIGSATWADAAA